MSARLEHHRSGAGEPLLLLHGVGHTWRAWRALLPALEPRFDVLAPDLPGFGGSAPLPAGTRPTPEALSDAVEGLLDELGWSSAHVVGNSLGGWMALELARRGRARSVVALSPAGMWTRREGIYGQAMLRLTRALAASPGSERTVHLFPLRVLAGSIMFGRPWRTDATQLAEQVRMLRESEAFDATRDQVHARHPEGLEDIHCPVLIAWGTRDRVTLPRQAPRWQRAIPGASLRWLPGCGHLAMLEDPELVATTIADWVDRTRAR